MNLKRIREMIAQIEACEEDFETSPATEPSIAAVESRLACSFPASYREFLVEFGVIWCADCSVSGIHGDDATNVGGGSVVGDTLRFRDEFSLPNHLVVIQSDEDAPYCLDLSGDSPEPPVVCFQLNTKTYQEISPDFETWYIDWFLDGLIDLVGDQ